MRALPAVDADNLDWIVAVQWRPRPLGLVRRFGGWRDKRRNPDQGGDMVGNGLDMVTSPYPNWDYSPARTQSGDALGRHSGGGVDLPSGGHGGGGGWFDDFGDDVGIIAAILLALLAVIVVAAAFWWVVLPLLAVLIDATLLVVLFLLGLVARVVFRRPWTIRAVSARGDRFTRKVVGWRNALRQRDDMVSALSNGTLRVAQPC